MVIIALENWWKLLLVKLCATTMLNMQELLASGLHCHCAILENLCYKPFFALLQYEGIVGNCRTFPVQFSMFFRDWGCFCKGGHPKEDSLNSQASVQHLCYTPWPMTMRDCVFHLQQELWMNSKIDCLASDSWQPWAGLGTLNLHKMIRCMLANRWRSLRSMQFSRKPNHIFGQAEQLPRGFHMNVPS